VRQIDESVHGSGLPLSRRRAVREGTEISNAAISRVGGEGGGRAKGQGTNNRKTALLVVGRSRAAAGGAGDAKVPFEDSYFPGSHGCHTRPPAILRLSLHCGNHNYTCGCLLIAARSPDPSRPTAAHPSRILFPSGCPLFQLRPRQEISIQGGSESDLHSDSIWKTQRIIAEIPLCHYNGDGTFFLTRRL